MATIFDGRGLKCPLGFVKAKQHLIKHKAKEYLLDDDMTLYNFETYLTKQNIVFEVKPSVDHKLVKIIDKTF